MEVKHNSRVLRSHQNVQPPAKQVTPVTAKKSVSVAAIFNQGQLVSKKDTLELQKPTPTLVAQHASDDKTQSLKSRSSSHSPHKTGSRVSKKKATLHPLTEAFKGMALSRCRLYITNTLQTPATTTADTSTKPPLSKSTPLSQPSSPRSTTTVSRF
jgi:hypothetical protein